jgi:hypothetical protein
VKRVEALPRVVPAAKAVPGGSVIARLGNSAPQSRTAHRRPGSMSAVSPLSGKSRRVWIAYLSSP